MSNVSHTCYNCPLLLLRMKHLVQTGWLCAKLMLELRPCCLNMYSILVPINEWAPFMSTLNAAVLTSGYVVYRHQQKFLSTKFYNVVKLLTSSIDLDSSCNHYGIPPWRVVTLTFAAGPGPMVSADTVHW